VLSAQQSPAANQRSPIQARGARARGLAPNPSDCELIAVRNQTVPPRVRQRPTLELGPENGGKYSGGGRKKSTPPGKTLMHLPRRSFWHPRQRRQQKVAGEVEPEGHPGGGRTRPTGDCRGGVLRRIFVPSGHAKRSVPPAGSLAWPQRGPSAEGLAVGLGQRSDARPEKNDMPGGLAALVVGFGVASNMPVHPPRSASMLTGHFHKGAGTPAVARRPFFGAPPSLMPCQRAA
jgi:hypothetical protein